MTADKGAGIVILNNQLVSSIPAKSGSEKVEPERYYKSLKSLRWRKPKLKLLMQ